MLQAMPAVIRQCPQILYIVLGMTHPVEKKKRGEMYRKSLEQMVIDLDIDEHVLFVDHFVRDEDLDSFIGAADIVVCPYHSQDQITSGVLSKALSRGKAIISTPTLHAQEALSGGRGILVSARDADEMALAVACLGKNENERRYLGAAAHAYSSSLGWDQISLEYRKVFARTGSDQRPMQNSIQVQQYSR